MKIIVEGNYIETDYIYRIGEIIVYSHYYYSFTIYFLNKNELIIQNDGNKLVEYIRKLCSNKDKSNLEVAIIETKQNIEELRTKLFEIWSANQSCIPNLKLKELNYKIEE